ncbi:hypothetical protein JHK82_044696 [Glycine max]|nr:hypothetical protein JHK86_045093 [Glycine max]KAG4951796.1 hypothetical protein JHK85_045663 [Glycine max]KAG5099644.1 hypothetical protein JHK82_044696 [Glycine max]KAG5108244.1 hypothetical protein JHK84_045151 [Glycine max]
MAIISACDRIVNNCTQLTKPIFTVLSQEMDLHNGDLKGCFIAGSGEDQIFSLRSIPKIHVPSCCPTHLSVCLPTIYVMIPRDKKEAMMETV